MRIAWATKGLEYIKNDIFGIGFGRNVFGHAIQKYEKDFESVRGMHSHSGIIDFTIGVGIIGLVIWLFFVGRIVISSALVFVNSGHYFSLMSFFTTSGFFIRSIVDSNMRDHMFKQFFLILGIALTLAAFENIQKVYDS
jgi:O-antigen ligase